MGARPASRERKERFILSFGDSEARSFVEYCLRRYGLSWLTDEQINEVTEDMVDAAVAKTRHVVRNRRRRQGAAA